MKTSSINNTQPNFQAKVSQRFINSMRGYVNNGGNRLQNNFKLTQKLEDYAKFGYDNYTIEMQQKQGALGFEYRLIAVKDGEDISTGINLTKTPYTSYRKIFQRFMNITRYDFKNIMKKYTKQ